MRLYHAVKAGILYNLKSYDLVLSEIDISLKADDDDIEDWILRSAILEKMKEQNSSLTTEYENTKKALDELAKSENEPVGWKYFLGYVTHFGAGMGYLCFFSGIMELLCDKYNLETNESPISISKQFMLPRGLGIQSCGINAKSYASKCENSSTELQDTIKTFCLVIPFG